MQEPAHSNFTAEAATLRPPRTQLTNQPSPACSSRPTASPPTTGPATAYSPGRPPRMD